MHYDIGMRIPPNIGNEGIEQVAQWAKGIGLDVLDVPRLTPEVKQAIDQAGLKIGTVDVGGRFISAHEKTREQAIKHLKEEMETIANLGGKVLFMVLIPEDHSLPRSEAFSLWRESFPEIVSFAEEKNLYIAIEGWPGPQPYYPTLGCTPETLRAMFEAIPSKHFGMTYDPSHLVRLGIDYIRVLVEFGDRIHHCHGKDTEILHEDLYEYGTLPPTFSTKYAHSEGYWRYTIPGLGAIDWGKVATRLDQMGYQGPISIELEDHRYWHTAEREKEGIRKALEHLRLYF